MSWQLLKVLAWILDSNPKVGGYIMLGLKLMMLDEGPEGNIRCRFINEWFRMDSFIPNKEMLVPEIDKIRLDVVVMDLDLYAKIDGIETSKKIRKQFGVPVMFF